MKLLCKLIACSFLLIAYSCSEPSLVGEELLLEPIPFNALRTDTVTVKLTTVRDDSLQTNGLGNFLMGYIEDKPVFGTTKASIFMQARLPSNNIDISSVDTLPTIPDSLVLRLGYNFYYGNSAAMQTIKVFELDESLGDVSDICYQSDSVSYKPEYLGILEDYQHHFDSITLSRPAVRNLDEDTVTMEAFKAPPHLRIKLSDTLRNQLFRQSGKMPFQDNTEFLDYFKGLYATVDDENPDKNLMVSYAIQNSSLSSLVLYYHTEVENYIYGDTINGEVDSSLAVTYNHYSQEFSINFNGKVFNRIINNYEKSNAGTVTDTSKYKPGEKGDSFVYIQGGGGLNIKVEFPYIKDGEFDDILINKATLSLHHKIHSEDTLYTPPSLITMYDANLYNDGFYTNDLFESRSLLNTDSLSNQMRYDFNFPALLQNIIEGDNSEEIILVPFNNRFTVNRAIIGGGNRTDSFQAKLELIYTETE